MTVPNRQRQPFHRHHHLIPSDGSPSSAAVPCTDSGFRNMKRHGAFAITTTTKSNGAVFKSLVVVAIVVGYLNYRAGDSMSTTTPRSVHEHTTIVVERDNQNDISNDSVTTTATPNSIRGSAKSTPETEHLDDEDYNREAPKITRRQLPQLPRRPYPPIVDNDMSDNPELQNEWSLWADKPMTGSFLYQPFVKSSSSSKDSVTTIYLPPIDIDTIYDGKSSSTASTSWLIGNIGSSDSYRPPSPKIQELALKAVSDGTGPTDSVLLTRRGHKGGYNGEMQPNQDRTMMLSRPRRNAYENAKQEHDGDEEKEDNDNDKKKSRLDEDWWIGLFDGHGFLGHCASEYVSLEFAKRIESEWDNVVDDQKDEVNDEDGKEIDAGVSENGPREGSTVAVAGVQNLITSIFEEINQSMPNFEGSGSTGISVWKRGNLVYVSNVGDSLAFVASFTKKINRKGDKIEPTDIEIIYKTEPHKPDSRRERERIEQAGGEVADPPAPGFSARLLIPHPNGVDMTGLAMSRSFGDFEATKYGLIARPTTMALDLRVLDKEKEYIIFAVTDGLVDKVPPIQVAQHMAEALIPNELDKSKQGRRTIHPLEAAEQLILRSSDLWMSDSAEHEGLYRDDISLVARRLYLPQNPS